MNNNYDTTTTTTTKILVHLPANSSDTSTLVGNSVLIYKNSGCGKIYNNILSTYYIMLGMMMFAILANDSQIVTIFQKALNSNFDFKKGEKTMDLYKFNN